jgi:hypothetical protein
MPNGQESHMGVSVGCECKYKKSFGASKYFLKNLVTFKGKII